MAKENDNLSDLEIRLFNATKKFVSELNKNAGEKEKGYTLDISETPYNQTFIKVRHRKSHIIVLSPFACLSYIHVDGVETGEIKITNSSIYKNGGEALKKYREILIQEIPEIKNRIEMEISEYDTKTRFP